MARSTYFINTVLIALAILGILCILSGHEGTILNKEGFANIGDISPGAYPQVRGLLEDDYPILHTKKCGLSKNGTCSRCAFEKRVKMGSYAQVTNNDLYKLSNSANDGTTFPSDLTFYGSRKTPAQTPPLNIGRGMRVNQYNSMC